MAVGRPADKATLDASVGALAAQVQTWAARVPDFKAWLDTIPDDLLKQPPFGYTDTDVATLRSAVADMLTLAEVYVGQTEMSPARDLSTFVRRLAGVPSIPSMV
jgi:hypothetical protein